MGGVKRRNEGGDISDDIHPSRKRRVEYSEADAKLAKIYNDLADDVQAVRLKAAGELVKNLSAKSEQQVQRIQTATARLIKGLCSGRKAARLGFSIALTELLRIAFRLKEGELSLHAVTQEAIRLTTVEGNISGQEKRDYLLGRRFAFQAILQSDVAKISDLPPQQWQDFVASVVDLASRRQWLRRECGAMLYEYLLSSEGAALPTERVQSFVEAFNASSLWKTPEGVALWIALSRQFPAVSFPKSLWHHKDPLSSKEKLTLAKVMQEVPVEDDSAAPGGKGQKSGARQAAPSFAWSVILADLYQRDSVKDFNRFWQDVVDNGLFTTSSSPERKALGLQVLSMTITAAPTPLLDSIFQPNIIRCVMGQRGDADRYLFEAAKVPLDRMIARGKVEPTAAAALVRALLAQGAVNFDQLTKSKTVETLLSQCDAESLQAVVLFIRSLLVSPKAADQAVADNHRRMLADLLLSTLRSHRDSSELFSKDSSLSPWLFELLNCFLEFAYYAPSSTSPPLSDASKSVFRSRLSSSLSHLLSFPLPQAVKASLAVVAKLKESSVSLPSSKTGDVEASIERAFKILRKAPKNKHILKASGGEAVSQAFQLLLGMSIIQVYNDEPDALSALDDLIACYESWKDDSEASTVLVELLLSFVSRQSALFRKLAEQVFSAFAPSLTADGLQSMLDILGQKESLSGQQELFDNREDGEEASEGEDEGDEDDDGDDDDEIIDVEEDSDVELVNGEEVSPANSDDDSNASSDDDGDSNADAGDAEDVDDEEAEFDKKLAAALGTAAVDEDEDEDGSDMDDEQMMALEPHLANIFKERKKVTGKKQEHKDAKENIISFKNRVLDLLAVYVKSQYANVLVLELIHPIVMLVRETTSKPTSEKGFAVLKQYFDACNKNKAVPRPDDASDCLTHIDTLHTEMMLGGSKLHANACSRSCLFISKVLVNLDTSNYEKVADMYAKLQSEWYRNPDSKVQGSVFTEWTSWSIATRKQQA